MIPADDCPACTPRLALGRGARGGIEYERGQRIGGEIGTAARLGDPVARAEQQTARLARGLGGGVGANGLGDRRGDCDLHVIDC